MESLPLSLTSNSTAKTVEPSQSALLKEGGELDETTSELLPSELSSTTKSPESFEETLKSVKSATASAQEEDGSDELPDMVGSKSGHEQTDGEVSDMPSMTGHVTADVAAQVMTGQIALIWPSLELAVAEQSEGESQLFGPLSGGQVVHYGQTMVGMHRASPAASFVESGPIIPEQSASFAEVLTDVEPEAQSANQDGQVRIVEGLQADTTDSAPLEAKSGTVAGAPAAIPTEVEVGTDLPAGRHGAHAAQAQFELTPQPVVAETMPDRQSVETGQGTDKPILIAQATEISSAVLPDSETAAFGSETEANSGSGLQMPETEVSIVSSSGQVETSGGVEGLPADQEEGVDTSRLADRIVQAARMSIGRDRSQGVEVRLRLEPPELGTLKLSMQVRQGQLSMSVEASSEAARQVLDAQMHVLTRGLAQHGLDVVRLEVTVQEQDAGGHDESGQGNRDGSYSEPRHESRPFGQSSDLPAGQAGESSDAGSYLSGPPTELGPQGLDMVA